jgi:hypothetical protein
VVFSARKVGERKLHKDYDRKGSVEKQSVVVNLKGLGIKTN